MKCSCGSRDIDFQESSGHAVCCNCGKIIEENAIVSSLEFEESGDRAHVIGQFVSADGMKPMRSNARMINRYTSSGESREITLANARRAIQQVASSLKLPSLYVDKAYRLYSKALQIRFMYGRQQTHIVATCLYTICRLEKSPHLLIDFSDALQVNVYVLGKAFLQFSRVMNLQEQLKVIDPALYLHRFSSRLNLGDKQNAIIMMSLRIITRMKKDWIVVGRRPDSICAIAMLIAARCHGINLNQGEIVKLFRISAATLCRRMEEFRATPAAQLSVQQFSNVVPTSVDNNANSVSNLEFDPPSYIRNQLKVVNESNNQITKLTFSSQESATSDVEVVVDVTDDSSSNKYEKIKFSGFDVLIPIPELKKKTTSLGKESKKKAQMELYDNIYEGMNSDIKDDSILQTCATAETDYKVPFNTYLEEELDDVINKNEIDSYLLNEEEQSKRSAIFEKSFRSFLDDRNNKRVARENEKSRISFSKYQRTQQSNRNPNIQNNSTQAIFVDKKSKKINYDVLVNEPNSQLIENQELQYPYIVGDNDGPLRKKVKVGSFTIPAPLIQISESKDMPSISSSKNLDGTMIKDAQQTELEVYEDDDELVDEEHFEDEYEDYE